MTKMYCTNDSCTDRQLCKHAELLDNTRFVYNRIPQFGNHCAEFKCKHPFWRNYPSLGLKECDNCHEKEPLFLKIQHQR